MFPNSIHPKDLPIGYKFRPIEEELVFYLLQRVLNCLPLPVTDIRDIDENELYSKPPDELVTFSKRDQSEWFFFINHEDEKEKIGTMENKSGFWKAIADPIYIGRNMIEKTFLAYFEGKISLENAKKTHWNMEEYRLNISKISLIWTLARLKRGRDHNHSY